MSKKITLKTKTIISTIITIIVIMLAVFMLIMVCFCFSKYNKKQPSILYNTFIVVESNYDYSEDKDCYKTYDKNTGVMYYIISSSDKDTNPTISPIYDAEGNLMVYKGN